MGDVALRLAAKKSGRAIETVFGTPRADMQVQIRGIELEVQLGIEFLHHRLGSHTHILIDCGT
jgi:hypothetical protein